MDKLIELFRNSGFTAVIASLVAVFISGIINKQIDKNREQQIFVRQIFPKRMDAHGVIFEALILMHEKFVALLSKPPTDRPRTIIKCSNRFRALYLRNMIWLDVRVGEYCSEIHSLLFDAVKSGKEEMTDQELSDLLKAFTSCHGAINKIIKTTSGMPLLDKTLSKMTVKIKEKTSATV